MNTDPRLSLLMDERGHLINRAYRFLGSLTEAEDAVQETYARWYALSPEQQGAIESPGAWLNTVVSRVCLDQLGSARARRERYVGEWIPEPVPDAAEWSEGRQGGTADPADRITLDESIDMAFLIVLDSMTPAERVTFLLHEVFRYPYAEVAEIVGRTPAACRQLATSARHRVRDAQPITTPTAQRAGVVRSFRQAWQAKDVEALIRVFDPAAVATADGGGLALAFLDPIQGGAQIAELMVYLMERVGSVELLERTVNGQPGLVAIEAGATIAVYSFDIANDQIQRMWIMRNPEKLRQWS
ncbi:MAG: polymerase, sigma-24 subunit, subfamily [Aeromicrobium sp.]|nr:polymerase, sigma-24 subunit, subfamily [Aeromicrobium sp.]